MKKDKLNIKKAKEWFRIGDDEIGFAGLGMKDKMDRFYSQIGFYCQQSVEKYLKGYLSLYNKRIEKIHDLEKLCAQCAEINPDFNDIIKQCGQLNKYYIPSRYPVHYEVFKKKDAKEAYKTAKEIILFVKTNLK